IVLVGAPLVGPRAPNPIPSNLKNPGNSPQNPMWQNSIVYWEPPTWKRQTITDAESGVMHGITTTSHLSDGKRRRESLLSASYLGIFAHQLGDGRWVRTR